MKHIDIIVSELCNDIDYWKSEALYWKSKYEEEVRERVSEQNERLAETQKNLANTIMFALSCTDSEDGSLVISAENRRELADNFIQ